MPDTRAFSRPIEATVDMSFPVRPCREAILVEPDFVSLPLQFVAESGRYALVLIVAIAQKHPTWQKWQLDGEDMVTVLADVHLRFLAGDQVR